MSVALHPLLEAVYLLYSPWDDARLLVCALHRVSLATACLSVSKDAHVEAVKSTLDEGLSVLEDFLLGRKGAETAVKVEFLFRSCLLAFLHHSELERIFICYLDYGC